MAEQADVKVTFEGTSSPEVASRLLPEDVGREAPHASESAARCPALWMYPWRLDGVVTVPLAYLLQGACAHWKCADPASVGELQRGAAEGGGEEEETAA
eukprot:scaffold109_cov252-Pinguiococcus_pyrenoidosus.AAC.72